MNPAETVKLKARLEQIKEIMRWIEEAEEMAFLELESKQISEKLKGFDEGATELQSLFTGTKNESSNL